MDRQSWLSDRRAQVDRWYSVNAPIYDEQEPTSSTHAAFLSRVIASVDIGGTVLDAPCGTGRYFGLILSAGRKVVGMDQSREMIAQARTRHPEVECEQTRLQELASDREFDAAICVDSMEYVAPEDWPLVLANLRRAIRPGGLIYLTVEEIDRSQVDCAYAEARSAGLPVVPGEHWRRGGGYHFYPTRGEVVAWLQGACLEVVADGESAGGNYGYWHLLVREAP